NAIVYPVSVLIIIIMLIILRKNMHKIMAPNIRKVSLIIYLVFLAMITIVFFVVQPKLVMTDKQIEQPPAIFEIIHDQDELSMLEPFKKAEWDMKLVDDLIKLQASYSESWMYIPVIVVEDKMRENEAHIVYYETPAILNGIDISSLIDMPDIEGVDHHIDVNIIDEMKEYEFHSIQHDAVLRQVQIGRQEGPLFDISEGEIAIVMTVPEGTTVVADVDQFDIIRK